MKFNFPINFLKILTYSILTFHAFITVHGFYTMYDDFEVFTIDHARPLSQLIFTVVWAAIVFKKRWGFFAYVTLIIYELGMKLFFGRYSFGEVFGDVFFPADLLFAFIILLLYKQHFNEPRTTVES